MTTLHQRFARALRDARESTGLTQEALAASAGIDRVFLSGMERGLHLPTLAVFFRLAGACGLTPGEFADRIGRKRRIGRVA